jgi:5'(3')-deoxyribonucleotidase
MPTREARKLIAVDLDQTLCHTLDSLVEWHNDTYCTNFSVTDFHTLDYWKVWGGTREETYRKIREFYDSSYFDRIKPVKDFALEALKMLKKRHFQLVIITSRQQFIAEKTKKFIDRHYPGKYAFMCNFVYINCL